MSAATIVLTAAVSELFLHQESHYVGLTCRSPARQPVIEEAATLLPIKVNRSSEDILPPHPNTTLPHSLYTQAAFLTYQVKTQATMYRSSHGKRRYSDSRDPLPKHKRP
ncbi:hypothetical protein EDD36DRAFT_463472 [Exophiala viscosa]|uniref:Uncharacterized protein n=1 Tax=Exophiala viscosa TaxID=2486360 RepID=A0AAN6IDL2_9EURO|nr:hypothetical protein EDD36DRAFT_463472 [Exophiala viscosa]